MLLVALAALMSALVVLIWARRKRQPIGRQQGDDRGLVQADATRPGLAKAAVVGGAMALRDDTDLLIVTEIVEFAEL